MKATLPVGERLITRDHEKLRERLMAAVGAEHQGHECDKGYGCDCSVDFLDAKDRATAAIAAVLGSGEAHE